MFGQKWLYSSKSGYTRKKFVFVQSGCIRVKVSAIGLSFFNRAKWLYSVKVVVIGLKWLYSGKICLFGQNGCTRARWLYSGKVVVFR